MARTRVAQVRNIGGVRSRGRSAAESSRRLRPAARGTAKGTIRIGKADPWHAIEGMVRRIVKRFDPERIILFGSYARGRAGPDSDVDLLVVMPVTGSRQEKAVEIGVALHGFDVPKDIVVTTPEDFAWRKDIPGTIERPAALEGRVLYARS